MNSSLVAILAILFFFVVFLVVAFSVYFGERVIRQPRETNTDELKRYRLKGEPVSFFSRDGIKLVGMFFPGTNGATVILLHGFSRSKEQMLPQASFLNAAGFSILMFDFRASGESGGHFITFGQKEQYDLEGAVRYLRSRPDIDKRRIGVFGFSMGGAVALLKSGELPEVKAVVVNSTFSRMLDVIKINFRDYVPKFPFFPFGYIALLYIRLRTGVYFPHIKPLNYIARLDPRPVLIIHGSHDETIPQEHASELLKSARGNKELWYIAGADHHGTYRVAGQQYEKRIIDFFTKYLLSPT